MRTENPELQYHIRSAERDFQAFQIFLLMFDTPLKQDYKDKVGEDPTKHFTDEELKERDRH